MLEEEHYHVLICHPETERILIRKDKRLPVIAWEGYLSRGTDMLCNRVVCEINAPFELIFLRVECGYRDSSWFEPSLLIFEVNCSETPELPEPPEDHMWVPQVNAHEVEVHPRTDAVIQYLKDFKRLGLEVNSDRLFPYSRAGWFEVASKWMKNALAKAGHEIKTVTQLRNGIESYILSGEAASGSRFYLKALPQRAFNDEVTVTYVLTEAMPQIFPKPLIADREKRWILMRDYGPTLSEDECCMKRNPDLVKEILCEWARVQKKSIPMVGELSRLGVPVHDANEYKKRVKRMLDDPEYLQAQWEKMTEEEKGKYGKEGYKREFLAYVERLCGRILEYDVPLTLVHGDLNAVNMIPDGNGSFMFIDFAYSCISFPFMDARSFMSTCGGYGECLDFYLELWTEFESMEKLRELLHLLHELSLVNSCVMNLHFYKKTEEGRRLLELAELGSPLCSKFGKYL